MTKPTITKRLAITAGAATLALATLGYVGATQLASSPKPVAKTYTASQFWNNWDTVVNGPSTVISTDGPCFSRSKYCGSVTIINTGSTWQWSTQGQWDSSTEVYTSKVGITSARGSSILVPGQTNSLISYGPNQLMEIYQHPLANTHGEGRYMSGIPVPRYGMAHHPTPVLTLADPALLAVNAKSWTVRFDVLAPYCYSHSCSGTTAQPTPPKTVTLKVTDGYGHGIGMAWPLPTKSGSRHRATWVVAYGGTSAS